MKPINPKVERMINTTLQVKKIIIDNPDVIENVNVKWMFNNETKELFIRIVENNILTLGKHEIGNTKTGISKAFRDYNKWM